MFVVVLMLQACRDPSDTADTTKPDSAGETPIRNLLVLSLDTLRWDQATDPAAMPFLSSHTQESGVLLESLWATGNWTQPTMSAVQTGVYGFSMGPSMYESVDQVVLPEAFPTLAERLSGEGYPSYLDTCNAVFHHTDATRGFDSIRICDQISALQQVERAEAWVEATRASAPSTPWLVQVHMNDAHDPFDRPWGECKDAAEALAAACPYDTVTISGLGDIEPEHQAACEAAVDARHDCDAQWLDHVLQQAWGRWTASGLLDGTAVVVVTDHGENYYQDNGAWPDEGTTISRQMGHNRGMNTQVSRGFGWVWTPELADSPTRITAATSQVDIVPTALHLIGRDDLATNMDGASALSLPAGRVVTQFGCNVETLQWHGASDAEHHMIVERHAVNRTEQWAMYDIVADPRETNPLPVEDGPQALKDALRAQMDASTAEFGFCTHTP